LQGESRNLGGQAMKYRSVFDIIGPIMIGPSSSHTAGANRIGRAARSLLKGEPAWAHIRLYGSFARTYRGHGTDVALVGGLLGFNASDSRIPRALQIAREIGLKVEIHPDPNPVDHPNTVRVRLGNNDEVFELVGVSTGGGKVEIVELNQFPVRVSTDSPALLIFHLDRPGVIAQVAGLLAQRGINIAHMEVSRETVGGMALMIVEVDQAVPSPLLDRLASTPSITNVTRIEG